MVERTISTESQLKEFLDSINPTLSIEDYEIQLSSFQKLEKNDLPYILNVNHLANLCEISPPQLHLFVSNKRKAYSTFKLPKKRGGFRKIDAPSKNMKLVQRWILYQILYKLNPGDFAHGFIPHRSIVTNASVHVGQELVLGIDLKDFFPSITLRRVKGLFRSFGYNEEISHAMAELCTFNWRFPQGAPTSPMISNLIAKRMDIKLSKFCNNRNLNYSRYADDITISGGRNLPRYKTLIFQKIEAEGFSINWEKVRLHDKGSSQKVTGLVVNDKVTLGREKKKKLKAIVYNIIKNGPLAENKDNDPFFKERIFGHLALAKMIEPDFADSLLDSLKCVDWRSYDEDLADLRMSELAVRYLEKKYYYNPDSKSQDIKLETDLLNVVFFFIKELKHYIEDRRWIESFWDDERELEMDGKKIKMLAIPKKEPKIQPTLHVFFEHRCRIKGIHVSRETDEGIGNLDFNFAFTTKTGIPINVCAEFKLAHNTQLEHGITKQLPLYLKANRSTSGMFLVMWFKDEEKKFFNKPIDKNKSQMIEFLNEKIEAVKHAEEINLESVLIDASKKPSASTVQLYLFYNMHI